IVLMREGRIIQNGRPEERLHNPNDPFVTRFIQAQRNPSERQTTV
ncbi:MAG: ABC transporter ATP-binding protein, partial [Acidobacteriota bacterium]